MHSVLTYVLPAALAVTSTAAFRISSFDELSKSINSTGGTSTGGSFTSDGYGRYNASIQCTSDAWASAYSNTTDSLIHAVARVVQDVCDPDWYGGVAVAMEELYGWASAYARAAATTHAACSATERGGRARGCAYSKANAAAAAAAFADIYASASAEAFAKYCTCANAEAWSFGEADLFVKIFANATANATAIACAQGNQESEASANVDCYASIYAETFALAAAKASADAGCYYAYADVHARTEVEAIVDAHVVDNQACIIIESDSGNAGSEGTGDANSESDHGGKKKEQQRPPPTPAPAEEIIAAPIFIIDY